MARLQSSRRDGGPNFAQQAAENRAQTRQGNPRLTRAEAEQMAIKNNPRVSVSRLLALAQHQVVREAQSGRTAHGFCRITAEEAEDASRISAGSLTSSRLFEHAGAGAT